MIGVISKPDEAPEVREFFELFKTPWEFYEDSQSYDVVIVTVDEVPELNAKLVLVYGAGEKRGHRQAQIALRQQFNQECVLKDEGVQIPIYGGVQTFDCEKPVLTLNEQGCCAGLRFADASGTLYRFGYDLFQEIRHLLAHGQPMKQAAIPALELHIDLLRKCILKEGLPLLEIPPVPNGRDFVVCLTHDIDFIGIRDHLCDHTMWGFLFRSTVGAIREFSRGRISVKRLLKIWGAAASLPFIYLGLKKDYWIPFEWYLKVEEGLSPTYYIIPFKNRQGERVVAKHAERRATAYDITDLGNWTKRLLDDGCEIGVHGIDSWNSPEKGREELGQVANATGNTRMGIRMHWLLRDESTYTVLENAGYKYDSTSGYNEAIGYRNGTAQVFRPRGATTLLELPLHIQDGALFYPQKMNLSEVAARTLCEDIIGNAAKYGGIVTLLWHDRSHGPERYWGEFYASLVEDLKTKNVWFATGMQAVDWFERRRKVAFERAEAGGLLVRIAGNSETTLPPLTVRVHPGEPKTGLNVETHRKMIPSVDYSWNGENEFEFKDTSLNFSKPISEPDPALAQ